MCIALHISSDENTLLNMESNTKYDKKRLTMKKR